jgi:hypothetical protein
MASWLLRLSALVTVLLLPLLVNESEAVRFPLQLAVIKLGQVPILLWLGKMSVFRSARCSTVWVSTKCCLAEKPLYFDH